MSVNLVASFALSDSTLKDPRPTGSVSHWNAWSCHNVVSSLTTSTVVSAAGVSNRAKRSKRHQ
eukprot:CAMPEP_0176086766 /NCGR_PEP_ID=MMETSP0120_2-20121206/43434_1 /TAXON_ID=160619 /ORGANISM="Kryptoperidinium foliaceum, Strain CCMP 1326" /LENGTH=62 /DNA_ID=CAMNT_0017420601 /DNA_START=241 /DNA_END=426 /DNA_ORIENTATION=+